MIYYRKKVIKYGKTYYLHYIIKNVMQYGKNILFTLYTLLRKLSVFS